MGPLALSAGFLFQEVPHAFDPQPCGGDGCYTNYLRVTDFDVDGDLDVIFPNSGSSPEPLVLWSSDGDGTFTNASTTAIPGGFGGFLRQIALGDVDGDGDPDLYLPSAQGDPDHLLVNDGHGVFSDESLARLPAGLASHAAAARMGDVDDDGDLDLLVGDRYSGGGTRAAHLYVNDGAGVFADATSQLPGTSDGDVAYDFDLFDADGDFDLDLLIDMHSGTSMLWTNDGAGTYTQAPFPAQGALKYGPVACDVDGDGDLDLWFDNAGPGYSEQLLINDGTGRFEDQTASRVTGNNGADDNGLQCVDVDGDGDLDAAIASLSDEERVLINDGTGRFALQPGAFSPAGDSTLWFEFGDVSGDGRLDCVTGQGESGDFTDRLYLGTDLVPVDTVPPLIRAVRAVTTPESGVAPVVRFAVSDDATSDEGPRLQRAYALVTIGGSDQEVPATFVGGDLFRAALPAVTEGTVTWSACAVDRQGNAACSDPVAYEVAPPVTTPPTETGDTGVVEDTGPGDTDGGSVDTGSGGEGSGCGCSTGSGGWGWVLAMVVAARTRRSGRLP
jgi:MYXO-CTERM domain-containing protein